jgi:hypothetical protein
MRIKKAWFALLMSAGSALAADNDSFVPLFNGHELTGWVNVNCAPETWSVRDGMIYCTGVPTGALRTSRQYENFILELEWRHLQSGGNSGVFIWGSPIAAPGVPFLRGIEVQVLDHGYNVPGKNQWYTTHGDVFPIHGATMQPFGRHNGDRSFPSEERSKGSPEWNHYRIACTNGVLRLHVNGKEVSGGEHCNYRKGYLALESEGAPIEFRNLRIKELPPSDASAQETAPADLGWRTLFNGVDFRGWQTNAATASRWKAGGSFISLAAGEANEGAVLLSEKEFGNAEFILDCKLAKATNGKQQILPRILLRGMENKETKITLESATSDSFQRFVINLKGRAATITANGKVRQIMLPANSPHRGPLGLCDTGGAVQFMNLYARDL